MKALVIFYKLFIIVEVITCPVLFVCVYLLEKVAEAQSSMQSRDSCENIASLSSQC